MNSSQETPIKTALPQLDLDNFDPEVMKKIWEEYGTFELIGETIDAFKKEIAMKTMEFTRKFLDLKNIENLRKCDDQGSFNGFQDLMARTTKRVAEGANIPIREQIAYILKPDLIPERRVPEGIDGITDVQMFEDYYAMAKKIILQPLYKKIADAFIDIEFRSDLSQEKGSTFATRRYIASQPLPPSYYEKLLTFYTGNTVFPKDLLKKIVEAGANTEEIKLEDEKVRRAKKVGIAPHTDFGLLTMVIQDAPGLEALTTSGEWVMAPCDPEAFKVIINIGDWALFQAHRSGHTQFKEGLHRVLPVEKYSLIVELNPPYPEKILTPKGIEVVFEEFLRGQKGKYRDTSRDESSDIIAQLLAQLRPVKPIVDFPGTPTLYVTECGKNGQEPIISVNGKDYPLCSKDMINVPEKAYDSFSYAYVNPEDSHNTIFPSRQSDKFARSYEVNLNCANDIYVVEKSETREETARTLIPLANYEGNYKNPVYLINRPLTVEEARHLTSEKKNLLQLHGFMNDQSIAVESKNEDLTHGFRM